VAKPNILIRSKKAKALALLENNQLQEADALFAQVCQSAPSEYEAWVMRGLIHRKLGRFTEAENFCRKAINLNPAFAWAHHILGSALQCQHLTGEAIISYRRAIQLKPDLAEAHYFLANALRETGTMKEAVTSYRESIRLQPSFVEAMSNLGAVLSNMGQTDEALVLLNKANALRPNTPQILCNLGDILQRDGRPAEALEHYQRALRHHPGFLDAIGNVAALLEKTGKLDEARNLIAKELPHHPENPLLLLAASKLARREKLMDEAIALLEKAAPQRLDPQISAEVHILLGQLYDSKGDYDRAFGHLETGNQQLSRTMEGTDASEARYFERLDKTRSWLTPALSAMRIENSMEAHGELSPVFLLGFPRSGTTLLEQILDSHPSLQTLEEKGTVSAMVREFEAIAQDRPDALAELSAEQVLQLRKTYFDEVAKHIQLNPGRTLVDKMPLNTVEAHLIWRVFPQARFILAIRHPCDVCLSCYMQNITLNEASASFCTLEGTARVYARVMGLWQDYVEALPLNYHRVRYEDLVADFEGETRALLEFLGVGWNDSVRDHTGHALRRGTISTPSYHQVTQPIYQHAKYRWKHYARHFDSVMPLLQPFIERFGYRE
jgi:tetratricopeptide (TPR) repeat protein